MKYHILILIFVAAIVSLTYENKTPISLISHIRSLEKAMYVMGQKISVNFSRKKSVLPLTCTSHLSEHTLILLFCFRR